MKKLSGLMVLAFLCFGNIYAQKLITKDGVIEIFSKTSLFTIEAKNQKVASILNTENGEVVASTLARSFKFKEALVEEHFNENYMESHLYPKAMFSGKIENFESVNLEKDGTYPIQLVGKLTMHGQTNELTAKGEIVVLGDKITAKTTLLVSLEKFKIKIEDSYKDRINDEIKLDVHFNYQPLKN